MKGILQGTVLQSRSSLALECGSGLLDSSISSLRREYRERPDLDRVYSSGQLTLAGGWAPALTMTKL